jgi:hypothetical protein
MKKLNLILLFNILIFINSAYSQGCSDAGFCSLNGIQNSESNNTTYNNQFKIGSSVGKADNNINIIAPYVSFQRIIGQKLSVSAKLTSISQSNENLSSTGLSDLFVISNYQLSQKSSITAGLKFPLNDGNNLNEDKPLPFDFQPSLGSTDLILAYATNINKLQINLATQLPISQTKNTFESEVYDSSSYFFDFQSTNLLERKGDILLRGSYELSKTEKFQLSTSLLSVYHLGEDTFIDQNNKSQTIEGSDGLTVNLNLFLNYTISQSSSINFDVGSPLIARKVRPDGLTRSIIASLGYKYQF